MLPKLWREWRPFVVDPLAGLLLAAALLYATARYLLGMAGTGRAALEAPLPAPHRSWRPAWVRWLRYWWPGLVATGIPLLVATILFDIGFIMWWFAR